MRLCSNGNEEGDEESGSPKKSSASFRFKSPSRFFGASFRDKSKRKDKADGD